MIVKIVIGVVAFTLGAAFGFSFAAWLVGNDVPDHYEYLRR